MTRVPWRLAPTEAAPQAARLQSYVRRASQQDPRVNPKRSRREAELERRKKTRAERHRICDKREKREKEAMPKGDAEADWKKQQEMEAEKDRERQRVAAAVVEAWEPTGEVVLDTGSGISAVATTTPVWLSLRVTSEHLNQDGSVHHITTELTYSPI